VIWPAANTSLDHDGRRTRSGAGFFHADLRAPNLHTLDDGRVGFLDFGLVGALPLPRGARAALGELLLLRGLSRDEDADDVDSARERRRAAVRRVVECVVSSRGCDGLPPPPPYEHDDDGARSAMPPGRAAANADPSGLAGSCGDGDHTTRDRDGGGACGVVTATEPDRSIGSVGGGLSYAGANSGAATADDERYLEPLVDAALRALDRCLASSASASSPTASLPSADGGDAARRETEAETSEKEERPRRPGALAVRASSCVAPG